MDYDAYVGPESSYSQWQTAAGDNNLFGSQGLIAPGYYPSVYGGHQGQIMQPHLFRDANDGWLAGGGQSYYSDPAQQLALQSFMQAHPGYGQLTPDYYNIGPDGQPQWKTAGASAGGYTLDPSQNIFSDEYGWMSPLSNLGFAGQPGTSAFEMAAGVFGPAMGLGLLPSPLTALTGNLGSWVPGSTGLNALMSGGDWTNALGIPQTSSGGAVGMGAGNLFGGGAAAPNFGFDPLTGAGLANSAVPFADMAGLSTSTLGTGVGATTGLGAGATAPFSGLQFGDLGFAGASAGGAGIAKGASSMDELMKLLKQAGMLPGGTASNLMNIGSGLYGLYESGQMRDLAREAAGMQDPFGPHRGQYANMLSNLYANPSSITSMPGYEAGLDAVTRKMAQQGYLGSGNMMTALHKYGGDFFNQEAQRLAQLAGAQFGPSGGSALLQGNQAANSLASQSLASLGYGVRGFGPQLEAFFKSLG